MKRFALLALLGWSQTAAAEPAIGTDNPCGLGVVLGQPTGLSGKCYIGGRRFGWDAVVAYSFEQGGDAGTLYGHTTALWHPHELVEEPWGSVSWYVGAGPFVGWWVVNRPQGENSSALVVGARAPVGIALDLIDIPLQFTFEVAIGLSIVPATTAFPSGGLGIRYYF